MEIRMKAPDGVTSASHDGNEYPVEDGHVTVGHEAVAALAEHGFEVVATTDAASSRKGGRKPKRQAQEEGGEEEGATDAGSEG